MLLILNEFLVPTYRKTPFTRLMNPWVIWLGVPTFLEIEMRVMSETEQYRLLKVIALELWGASMVNMDDILYGSAKTAEASGKEYRSIQKIMEAVPSDIRDEYNLSLRKAEADELREKAAKIERGENV